MSGQGPAAALAGVRALVFDKDGTLFDFTATWGAFTRAYIDGLTDDAGLRAALARAMGYDMAAARFHPDSIVIAATADEIVRCIAPLLPGHAEADLVVRMNAQAARATPVPVVPLAPFLRGLRAGGYGLGVATNDAEAAAFAHLEGAGVRDLFDFVAGYDSGHGAKPAPGPLVAFARAVDTLPARCAMVGDSLHDLHAGRAAGMVTIGVLTGVADRAALLPAADIVLDSIADLPAALGVSPQ